MSATWMYICVLTFVSVISIGTSLQCYECNVVDDGAEPQKKCEEIKQCNQNSVCLSSLYNVTRDSDKRSLLAKVKSCVMKTGKECEMANASHLQGYTVRAKHSCQVCEEDGCNRDTGSGTSGLREASISLLLTICFASLIWSNIQ